MKTVSGIAFILLVAGQAYGHKDLLPVSDSGNPEQTFPAPTPEIFLPVFFMGFLVFMLVTLVKYFLDFRLKSKLINRGMAEQLSAQVFQQNDKNKKDEVVKLAILFCGIGIGLLATYFTAPIHLHSLAIMAFSLGLSYLAYFFYLRK